MQKKLGAIENVSKQFQLKLGQKLILTHIPKQAQKDKIHR